MMIILTAEQSANVAGVTPCGAELRPVQLADGITFVLPPEVLTDPAHAAHHEFLASLPQREIMPEEWTQPEIPSA